MTRRILIALNLFLCSSVCAETHYYLVEGAMELPTGRRVGTSLSLAKRTVDRAAGKIEEVVLSMRGRREGYPVLPSRGIFRTRKAPRSRMGLDPDDLHCEDGSG